MPAVRCEAELSQDELEQTNALLEQRRVVLSDLFGPVSPAYAPQECPGRAEKEQDVG